MRISDWSSDVCSSDLFQIEAFQRFDEQQRVLLRAETADKDDARFPTLLALERAEQHRVDIVRNDRHALLGHAIADDLLLHRAGRDDAMTGCIEDQVLQRCRTAVFRRRLTLARK